MSDGDDSTRAAAGAATDNTVSTSKQQQQQEDYQQHDGGEWRRWMGKQTRETGSAIDSNLSLFRVGCLLTMVGSIAAVARFSGAVSVSIAGLVRCYSCG